MKKTITYLFTFALFAVLATTSFAQKGNDVERKIKFAKGKSSATVKDSIADRNTTHSWIVGAKAGQTMTVVFTSTRKDVDFCISYPNGGADDDSCSKRNGGCPLHRNPDPSKTFDSLSPKEAPVCATAECWQVRNGRR